MLRKFVLTMAFLCSHAVVASAATKNPTSVFAETIKNQTIYDILTYPARIESRVNALVLTETDGVVTRLHRPLGSKVRKGEAIATIRHNDPVYQYAPLIVPAPVSGVISQVYLTEGALVSKGERLVAITAPDQLRIVIEVAAQDVKSLHAGQAGELRLAGGGDPIKIQVKGLSPSIDPMLGTASCELTVPPDAEKILSPGLVGRVQFKVNERSGILVAENAIVYKGEETFVRLINREHADKPTAKRVAVHLGEKKNGQIEILSGLKSGDEIIDRASGFVSEGEEVKIETQDVSGQ